MKNNILVVDDDQLIQYALAKILKNDGYEVVTAATATEAIEKISFCPFDLCLLDVHLPDLDGLELMTIIRDMCPEAKVVIMTASHLDSVDLSDYNSKAFANGASRFIAKPFNLCDITEVVEQVLAGKEGALADFTYPGNHPVTEARKKPRKFWSENVFFQMSVIERGKYTRKSLEARAVDISENGIGFLTGYPLREAQVIGFDEKMDNRTGVVVWSKMEDDDNCRVGVRFV